MSRALVAVLCLTLAPASAGAAARFALSIGNNLGRPDEAALRWAENDAARVHALLQELGAVAPGRAILLTGADPTRVRSAIARLQGQVEEAGRHGLRTEVFVFFSGHGDSTHLHLGQESLALADLQGLLRAVPADAVVSVIDACRSSGPVRRRDKGARHGPAFDIRLARQPGPTGRVLITSAGSDEVAQESDELKGSFFTHHMLSGLRGAADADSDGRVSLAEIYAYTYHHTLTSSHGETAAVQHPEMALDLEGEGELVVTVLERASARLTLPAALSGDFLVVDDHNGRVFAEVRKTDRRDLILALPAGRYRVQLRRAGKIYAGEVALEWGGRRTLASGDLSEQALVAALIKGSELDPRPFAIRSGALAAAPTALGTGTAYGGDLGLEIRLGQWPVFLMAGLSMAGVQASNDVWRYRHLEFRLTAGLGYGLWLGPVRLAASVGLGALIVEEHAVRRDASRVGPVTGVATSDDQVSIGPSLVPGLALRIPVSDAWALSLRGEVPITFLSVEDRWQTQVGWGAGLGVEVRF